MLGETTAYPKTNLPLPPSPEAQPRLPDDGRMRSKGARVHGYVWRFGEADLVKDEIMPGAISASLSSRGASGIRMLFQHDPSEIIGKWLIIEERPKGIYVEGELNLGVQRGRELDALIQQSSLDGLSLGFQTRKARRNPESGRRQVFDLDLWEISIVAFPMLPSARLELSANQPAMGSRAPRMNDQLSATSA